MLGDMFTFGDMIMFQACALYECAVVGQCLRTFDVQRGRNRRDADDIARHAAVISNVFG